MREIPGEALIDSVAARLRQARILLILDNCEHLTRAVSALAGELLTRCRAVRILATRRESVGVDGNSWCRFAV